MASKRLVAAYLNHLSCTQGTFTQQQTVSGSENARLTKQHPGNMKFCHAVRARLLNTMLARMFTCLTI